MKIEIIDNQDDWMRVNINNRIWYDGHISSFNNWHLRELLEMVTPPDTIVTHDDNPENFEE